MSEKNIDNKKISDGKLLYDPMFDKKAALDWKDSEKGGIFGKAVVKKALFLIVLLISIGGSLFFSFSSLSTDKYEYSELENGTYKLTAFHGQKNDQVLCVDYVRDENNIPDTSKPVSAIREYTSSGNDSMCFLFIGKDVEDIENTAFFYCTSLYAVYVDKDNENFTDIDGILYRKENGVITEAILCPQQHTKYMTALEQGEKVPENVEEAAALGKKFLDDKYAASLSEKVGDENTLTGKTVVLPDTVTKIGQLCFAYCEDIVNVTLPSGLKEIETMAFFKCSSLSGIDFPTGLETIGSDAFSKCGNVDYLFIPDTVKNIGHHAFYDCGKIEKVYMQSASLDGMELGQDWMPQYRKTFMKNREVVFGSERGVR